VGVFGTFESNVAAFRYEILELSRGLFATNAVYSDIGSW